MVGHSARAPDGCSSHSSFATGAGALLPQPRGLRRTTHAGAHADRHAAVSDRSAASNAPLPTPCRILAAEWGHCSVAESQQAGTHPFVDVATSLILKCVVKQCCTPPLASKQPDRLKGRHGCTVSLARRRGALAGPTATVVLQRSGRGLPPQRGGAKCLRKRYWLVAVYCDAGGQVILQKAVQLRQRCGERLALEPSAVSTNGPLPVRDTETLAAAPCSVSRSALGV